MLVAHRTREDLRGGGGRNSGKLVAGGAGVVVVDGGRGGCGRRRRRAPQPLAPYEPSTPEVTPNVANGGTQGTRSHKAN